MIENHAVFINFKFNIVLNFLNLFHFIGE